MKNCECSLLSWVMTWNLRNILKMIDNCHLIWIEWHDIFQLIVQCLILSECRVKCICLYKIEIEQLENKCELDNGFMSRAKTSAGNWYVKLSLTIYHSICNGSKIEWKCSINSKTCRRNMHVSENTRRSMQCKYVSKSLFTLIFFTEQLNK